jgi:hypothetical protein
MGDRSLIVARLKPGGAPDVARLFAASDGTDLPHALGVRRRHLFGSGDPGQALRRAAERVDFQRLSADLAEFVSPYDPATWRGPADAMATEFYGWVPA